MPCKAETWATRSDFLEMGADDIDRVKIQSDDVTTSISGPPADIGATNFTIEFRMKAQASENGAPAVQCGRKINWIYGNIVFDRDRYDQDRKFGVSIAGNHIVFGISGAGTGDQTICGRANIVDSEWHHIAAQRRRSHGIWLYVDGKLDVQGDGPDGDISYPDDGVPATSVGDPARIATRTWSSVPRSTTRARSFPRSRGRLMRFAYQTRFGIPSPS